MSNYRKFSQRRTSHTGSIDGMRLTIALVSKAPVFLNAIGMREMDLRARHVSALENVAVIAEKAEVVDLTHNELTRLDNLTASDPTTTGSSDSSSTASPSSSPSGSLRNIKVLLLSHNLISRIDPLLLPTAPQQLPALSTIDLSHNRISDLQELAFLSSLPALRHLSLHANPLTALPQYRIRAIALLPRIKWLDFRKITAAEKKAAVSLAKDSSSTVSSSSSSTSSSSTSSSTSSSSSSSSSSSAGRLSDKQKDLLRQAITRASSLEQIMALEAAASAGILEQEVTRLGL